MLKQLDGQGKRALSAYEKALKDESPAVRYWAIVGIHHAVDDRSEREKWREVLFEALNDPAPTVKVAAAHALCDWGEIEKGLSVLTELLRHQNEFVRLYAINALRHLGEKAKPALPAIEKALKDPSGYVQRVARTILKQFGKRT
jgi:HEAT repeat protein